MGTHDDFADSLALIKPGRRLVRVVDRDSDRVVHEEPVPPGMDPDAHNTWFSLLAERFDLNVRYRPEFEGFEFGEDGQ